MFGTSITLLIRTRRPYGFTRRLIRIALVILTLKSTAAAEFYAATFPDSRVISTNKAPSDFPGGKEADELTVEFTILGKSFVGLNGGPIFKPNEAVSFLVSTENQEETDRYWNAIVDNGGKASECGWCGDRW